VLLELLELANLPYANALFWPHIELRASRHVECLIPIVHIADRIASIFPRGMGVCGNLLAQRTFGLDLPPSFCKCQEKALLAGQSIDYRIRFAVNRQQVGIVRYQQSCQISDVFRGNLLTINTQARQGQNTTEGR
jgi:hypothetical protein